MEVAITHCEGGHAATLRITTDTDHVYEIRVDDVYTPPEGSTIEVELNGKPLMAWDSTSGNYSIPPTET